jgi:glyoxylase-like metal-dependent hydrolase (beta-lactamase superfamily II)
VNAGRFSRLTEAPERDRHTWANGEIEPVGEGVYRIPLPMSEEGLRAVNVYALVDGSSVDLIDAGDAIAGSLGRLEDGLRRLGRGLSAVRRVFITHFHRDHYSLAPVLRRKHGSTLYLGVGEKANIEAMADAARGRREAPMLEAAERTGAALLKGAVRARSELHATETSHFEPPDHWLSNGAFFTAGAGMLQAVHTPGHTRGHMMFCDEPRRLTFTGDHLLPQITPSLGLEPMWSQRTLSDYLMSLERVLALPDTRILPAHGPIAQSTHRRAEELLAHHEIRLEQIFEATTSALASPFEIASRLTWTRHGLELASLTEINQLMGASQTTSVRRYAKNA